MKLHLSSGPFARNPRKVRFIVIHCSATPPDRDIGVSEIRQYHLKRGFNDIGYHFVVRLDGTIESGRPLGQVGAHCLGKNDCSIGVCYVGGVASDLKTSRDTRTDAQRRALNELIDALKQIFPYAEVRSHRDFAPKACPSFDATTEYRKLSLLLLCVASLLIFSSCRSSKQTTEKLNLESVQTTAAHTENITASIFSDSTEVVFESPVFKFVRPDSTTVKVTARAAKMRRIRHATQTSLTEENHADSAFAAVVSSHKDDRQTAPSSFAWWPWLLAIPFLAIVISNIKRKFFPSII